MCDHVFRPVIHCGLIIVALCVTTSNAAIAFAQALGAADRSAPGDEMIQNFLRTEALRLDAVSATDYATRAEWEQNRPRYRDEFFYMLGLSPLPERTPLHATVTGTVNGEGYVVENLHYQSRPRLYVTANLYRPEKIAKGEKLPAVLYVCGHSSRGRNGGKTAFQSHGIWLAKHGYICLIVDTLQLGEIAGIHHGTYNRERWSWHSRGYTSAGVECWNGVRGIDYLISRPDVDPERLAVTGISGGGAATFWIAAADDRIKVAIPVSGMADLEAYVPNRVINGHCDCMFLYNTFQWPWTRIAGLIAPRPMLFMNSDQDAIFPMDANGRITNRLERCYSLYGASDRFDTMVSVGGHDYREDLRRARYQFLNAHLKGDARPVTDSEQDLVTGDRNDPVHPIDPEKLRGFPTDADLPKDELNSTIDEHFVPLAKNFAPTNREEHDRERQRLLTELKRVAFRSLPAEIPAAKPVAFSTSPTVFTLEFEDGIRISSRLHRAAKPPAQRTVLVVSSNDGDDVAPTLLTALQPTDDVYLIHPRGVGKTAWTRKNPPNYVERSHALLGRTVDTSRVSDVAAVAKVLKALPDSHAIHVAGLGNDAILAAYAALWEPAIQGVIAIAPPASHLDNAAPQFLNILRVADVPTMFGLLADKELTLRDAPAEIVTTSAAWFKAAGASERFKK
ncbi:MAG: prolyl oligopeptidase family serine peptidase [Planctomycetaceae bacterium]|nr:prolyl oligopeptidase family serine peptidase [Planctomycetaceae bacterium]